MKARNIHQCETNFRNKLENVHWLMGCLIAQIVVMDEPTIVNLSAFSIDEVEIDELKMPLSEIFGQSLSFKDRNIIQRELQHHCFDLLVADSTDILIECVCRAWAIYRNPKGIDPYFGSETVKFTGSRLYSGNKNEASLFTGEEKKFIELVAWRLRNITRHHLKTIPPSNNPLSYNGEIHGQKFALNLQPGKQIKVYLNTAYKLFKANYAIGNSAFTKLISMI